MTWHFDKRGYKAVSGNFQTELSWRDVAYVARSSEGMLIYPKPIKQHGFHWNPKQRDFFWIPKNAFASPEDFQAVRDYFQQSRIKLAKAKEHLLAKYDY